jgi:hypothetical protein
MFPSVDLHTLCNGKVVVDSFTSDIPPAFCMTAQGVFAFHFPVSSPVSP